MFNVGDVVIYRNGGNPRLATIIEVSGGGCPYRLNVPYNHFQTGQPMNFSVWVPAGEVSSLMPTLVELKACREYFKKTHEETPEEAYDRAMGVI